jgi:protein involved in polysaccharide export with SLBB domain
MNVYHKAFLMLMLLLTISCSNNQKEAKNEIAVQELIRGDGEMIPPPPLVLGAGDKINFRVWRHDDLQSTVQIDPSGNISLPLVGGMKASGLTLPQLKEEIRIRLAKYFVDPQVDVALVDLSSHNIYVLGEVISPGAFVLDRRISALEAISKAEGFTNDANQKAVLLVRAKGGQAEVVALNLSIREMAEEGKAIQNVHMKNKDILYVPPENIVDIERFMIRLSNIIRPILDVERVFLMGSTLYDLVRGKEVPTGVVY